MEEAMESQSLQMIALNNDTIVLNEEDFTRILMKEEIRDKYISVISISGVFRQGKSFLLNFLLRYLYSRYVQRRDVTKWLKLEDGPLKGFSWASGSKRHTTGIHMWPDIFLAQLSCGTEVAIILLDTQGSFDNQSPVSDSAKIFALSTLISSVQIYNLMQHIKQHDLIDLQCFGGYGKLISNTETAPFQNIIFLVRDWQYAFEKPYGYDGGRQLLDEVFSKTDVENIKELFNDVSCFLLPHPGPTVATAKSFSGSLDEIDKEFLKYVEEFVPSLLAPENLVLKTVHGEKIKAEDLVCYIKEYYDIFKKDTLPPIITIHQATVEAHYKTAVHRSVKMYEKFMDNDFGDHLYCTNNEFDRKQQLYKKKVLELYGKFKKFEDPEVNDKYTTQLNIALVEIYRKYKNANDRKFKKAEMEKQEKLRREIQALNLHARVGIGASSSFNSRTNTETSISWEQAGTAAAVIGSVAALAFGASKLFSPKNNKQ